MLEIQDEFDPPFEAIEPARVPRAAPVQLAAQRTRLSARVPAGLAARSRDPAPLRGLLRRRVDRRRGRARPSAGAGALPALLCRRQPRALRTRPAHVRRPAALIRQYPLDAGGRRPRHRGARRRRRPGNLRPAHLGRAKRCAASTGSTSPITGRCGAVHAAAPRFRRRHADRLPFHAVGDRRQGRAAARRPGASATATARAALPSSPRRSRRPCAASAMWSAATSPMPAASSPSTTAIRPPGCTRSSSRSTARSTWTNGATSGRPRSRRLAGEFEFLADRLAEIPLEELRPYRAAAE